MAAARLRIICGPTAAGKSAIALELAERFAASLVSADSRQIYRGFDIGTAKPTADQRGAAPHYGIDVADPTERYSAARWAGEAQGWIEIARAKGKEPVVVGGTGLYIKALVEPLFSPPPLEPARRGDLARELEQMSIDELRRWCRELDPVRARLGRTQLLRAIETVLLSGRRVSELHAAHKSDSRGRQPMYAPSYLLIDPGTVLATRIETRIERMLAQGWRDEVAFLSREVPADAPAWKSSGYSVMRSVVRGELDLSIATERVIIETRQYAKRQRTWFRHQLPPAAVTRINPDDPAARVVAREWWEKTE